jgi:alpha-glucosidase
VVSRWGGHHSNDFAKMLFAMISSLRGSVCSYQGEELGLTEADIAFEDVQDPYGITFWPQFKGRDGCRTPHPWQHDLDNAGFTQEKPWLPVSNEHVGKSVDLQDEEIDSVLNSYRHFNRWRKEQPELLYGDIEFIESPESILAFIREYQGKRVLVCFNFTEQTQHFSLGQTIKNTVIDSMPTILAGHKLAVATIDEQNLVFPAFGCFYGYIK